MRKLIATFATAALLSSGVAMSAQQSSAVQADIDASESFQGQVSKPNVR
jgi:hypothetical protein